MYASVYVCGSASERASCVYVRACLSACVACMLYRMQGISILTENTIVEKI